MGGHDQGQAHKEDHMVCVKVGIFFIFVVAALFFIAL